MIKSKNNLDDVFEKELKQRNERFRRNAIAKNRKRKKEEAENKKFQKRLQNFTRMFLDVYSNSPKFAEYLKQHTIIEQNFFSFHFEEKSQNAFEKKLGRKFENKDIKKEDGADNEETVRYSLVCICEREDVSAPMLGFNRTIEADVLYEIQIVRKYGTYKCGLYRLTTNGIGQEQFHEVAFSPKATTVMKKLMNPKTFMQTVIEHNFSENEL